MKGAPASGLLVVIGCGNLNRSDDGAGVRVIRRLQQEFAGRLPASVRLFDAGTSGIDVMFQARGAAALIVVDACRSGSEPGAIFTLPADELGMRHEPGFSLHDFRWDHALYAGRRIFGAAFPDDVTALLIEAGSLELGLELTPPVAAAVESVGARIAPRIRARDAAFVVRVGGGRIGVPRDTYQQYLAGVGAVALTLIDGEAHLIPLRGPVAGGRLVKQRNLHGDRVIEAGDFLADYGVGEFTTDREFPVLWITETGALRIEGLRRG